MTPAAHVLGRTSARGLSREEARLALARWGPNEIEDRERRRLAATLKDIATEPMFGLLLAAATVYLVLGDLGEGALLAGFAVATVGLVLLQSRRSERALDALRDLAAPRASVIRDGEQQVIPARELVPGDLMVLSEGERVPADGVAREAVGLAIDESTLTGESVPVRKSSSPAAVVVDELPGGDDRPWTFAGTLVVSGRGIAEVAATGSRTQVGRIGASLARIESAATPLQRHLGRLVRVFGVAAVLASAVLVLYYGLQRGNWMQGLLSALALGMAMLPEEFPMALSVFLAMGAWRLARLRVLARRPAVVEALGAATVLCVDKTGTLTENRMVLRRCVTADADEDAGASLPEPVHRLLEHAALASRRGGRDPMDRALVEAFDRALGDTEHAHPAWRVVREFPLTPSLPATTTAWEGDGRCHLATKGAPEAVMDLCHLDAAEVAAWSARVQRLAERGWRVLAVASGTREAWPTSDRQHDHDFEMLGLVAFEDPLRESVPAAVAQAREAGIAVAMITGDHAATAMAIARAAGLDVEAGVLAGERIDRLDDAALADAVRRMRVFARVLPEQKLRLVQAFRANGETVAMTGDGVNDAPALKAAHIGIAMGRRGTDVAREAAGLVLLDDDFGHLVAGVRMGRRIFDNLRKVMTYITAIHVPIVGLAVGPVLLGLPPMLLPVHVVLTEMVIDPVCSLGFEGAPEEPRIMSRPPRRSDDGIVGWPMLWRGLLQGGGLLAVVMAAYLGLLAAGRDADVARTVAMLGLTFGNLALVAVDASQGTGWRALLGASARLLWGVAIAVAIVLGAAVMSAAGRRLLHFGVPAAGDVVLMLAAAGAVVALAARLTARSRS